MNNLYLPDGPYTIKTGRFAGQCLEVMAFENYPLLCYLRKKCEEGEKPPEKMNEYHQHLLWLMARSGNRRSKKICPQCGKNAVTNFSVIRSRFGISISANYVCCDRKECREKLIGLAGWKTVEILPFKFSVLNSFPNKTDRRSASSLFRAIFKIDGRLTREKAFAFFAEN